MRKFSIRDKLILAGLFLSKYDREGLETLGFNGFTEAFNAIALSLKARPASIKNYRDEFDPLFPNPRKGWHKRPIRQYCKGLMDEFEGFDIQAFSNMIKAEVSSAGDLASIEEAIDLDASNSFAKRLITGQAAEKYFEMYYKNVADFSQHQLINTTSIGCGFDYKMVFEEEPYLAVEVKGLSAPSGSIQLTSKEYSAARILEKRYFLFVVRNFTEKPFYSIFQNPVQCGLEFQRRETVSVQESWTTAIR